MVWVEIWNAKERIYIIELTVGDSGFIRRLEWVETSSLRIRLKVIRNVPRADCCCWREPTTYKLTKGIRLTSEQFTGSAIEKRNAIGIEPGPEICPIRRISTKSAKLSRITFPL